MSYSEAHKPLFRSERYATIGGVCAGIALARGYSVVLIRILALFLLSTGIGLPVYIACWLLLPVASSAQIEEPLYLPNDQLLRPKNDRVLAGVCSSIARALGIDVSIVRVIYFLLVILGGISILPYFYAWIVIPQEENY